MNKKKVMVLIFVLIIQNVLYLSDIYAQGSFRERIKERIRERQQKKQQITNNSGAGDYDFSLVHDGLTRKYKVHLPSNYDKADKTPVVIYLHGGGGGIKAAYKDGMDKAADKFGFILIIPVGTGPIPDRLLTWNAGKWPIGTGGYGTESCCGSAVKNNIDDVGFISKVIEEVKNKFKVDEKRIYATGISNGGMMSYRLACELSDKIAVIAPVAPPAVPMNCAPSKPVPVMHIHGTADPCAPYNGGTGGGCLGSEKNEMQSAKEMVDMWKNKNKCSGSPIISYQKGDVTCISYNKCAGDSEVEFCTIEGGGHTWPSGSQYLSADKIGPVSYDISFDQIWKFFKRHSLEMSNENHIAGKCGDGLCEQQETKASCPQDCDEVTCKELYKTTEQICLEKGWKKVKIDVNGIEREMLWKAPQTWKYGAIIAMHGGEGVDSNFCSCVPRANNRFLSEILRGVPTEEFGELALKEGFAVFSLNSAYNRVTDAEGRSVGKRWDSLAQEGKKNIDLPFIEKVIDDIIPSMKPSGSSDNIFVTGISNGGFMTILSSTHFSDKITAFAPVSAGDPYGTYFDVSVKGLRKCGPGVWRDSETNEEINLPNACASGKYPNEIEWPQAKKSIPFKQFHNKGDAGCDFSCMQKVEKLLVEHRYKDDGAFIIDRGKRNAEEHFWQREYNQPMIEFFKRYALGDARDTSFGPGDHKFTISHNGLDRTYRVYVPMSYNKNTSTPLIINLHGGYGNAEAAEKMTSMSQTADKEGFIVVYPNAARGSYDEESKMYYQHWNAGPRADSSKSPDVDDVGFISKMIDKLKEDFNIDSSRIYATGMSNGATMVYRLACQLFDKIAAFAPVAGNQLDIVCKPTRSVPIILFHGLADNFATFDGKVFGDQRKPIPELISEWVRRNGCSQVPAMSYPAEGVACKTYGTCSENAEVVLCTIEEAGHTWPGTGIYMGARVCEANPDGLLCKKLQEVYGRQRYDFSANDAMWEFFKRHPKK